MRRWRQFNRKGVAGQIENPLILNFPHQANPTFSSDQYARKKKKVTPQRRDTGQGLVEFALLLPIITLILFGAVDFGRLYCSYVAVNNASRVGVEYGMDTRRTAADIRSAIKQECPSLNLTDADITLIANPSWSTGSELTVQVRCQFQAITPLISDLWGGGPLTLTGSTVARLNSP